MSDLVLSAEFIQFLVPIAISVLVALVISVIAQRGIPSVKMFLLVLAISITAFTVEGALPEYSLGMAALCMGVIWFGGRNA